MGVFFNKVEYILKLFEYFMEIIPDVAADDSSALLFLEGCLDFF
jgi:hypothetical protein